MATAKTSTVVDSGEAQRLGTPGMPFESHPTPPKKVTTPRTVAEVVGAKPANAAPPAEPSPLATSTPHAVPGTPRAPAPTVAAKTSHPATAAAPAPTH